MCICFEFLTINRDLNFYFEFEISAEFNSFYIPIGLMLKYITPLTVAPAVSMIGIYLFKSASSLASLNWPISMR